MCVKNNYVTKPSEIFFSDGWPQVQDAGIGTAVIGVSDAGGLNKSDDFRDVSIAVGPCPGDVADRCRRPPQAYRG